MPYCRCESELELEMLARTNVPEMKQIHTPQGIFHIALQYFTHEVYFTNPQGFISFTWGSLPECLWIDKKDTHSDMRVFIDLNQSLIRM